MYTTNPAAAVAAGLNGFAHSFSISSLMNAAAAASSSTDGKFDLNSYSQMYGAASSAAAPAAGSAAGSGASGTTAAGSAGQATQASGASGPAGSANEYYAMYN